MGSINEKPTLNAANAITRATSHLWGFRYLKRIFIIVLVGKEAKRNYFTNIVQVRKTGQNNRSEGKRKLVRDRN